MPTLRDRELLVSEPREDLSVEIMGWLDLSTNDHRATLAKAAIALVNHGGGFLIIDMKEAADGFESVPKSEDIPEVPQGAVNAAIRRFEDPAFQVELYLVTHPHTDAAHPVISSPSTGNLKGVVDVAALAQQLQGTEPAFAADDLVGLPRDGATTRFCSSPSL